MVELPAEGGVPLTHQSYITFNTFNSYDALHGLAIGDYGDAYWARLGDDGGGWMGDRWAFDGFPRYNPDHGWFVRFDGTCKYVECTVHRLEQALPCY